MEIDPRRACTARSLSDPEYPPIIAMEGRGTEPMIQSAEVCTVGLLIQRIIGQDPFLAVDLMIDLVAPAFEVARQILQEAQMLQEAQDTQSMTDCMIFLVPKLSMVENEGNRSNLSNGESPLLLPSEVMAPNMIIVTIFMCHKLDRSHTPAGDSFLYPMSLIIQKRIIPFVQVFLVSLRRLHFMCLSCVVSPMAVAA